MRKLLLLIPLLVALPGCAQLKMTWDTLAGITVTPTQIIVAANSMNAVEATAKQYLLYCKANPMTANCDLATRQKVVDVVRKMRKARNDLEPYVVSNTAGPSALFSALMDAIAAAQSDIPNTGASK